MLSRLRSRWFASLGLVASLSAESAVLGRLQLETTTLEVTSLAGSFETPFDLVWGPDGQLWCTQLDGTVFRIDPNTGARSAAGHLKVFTRKSHGLQSMAFHPHFATEPYAYFHYVYLAEASGADEIVRSRLVRCRWDGTKLGAEEIIFDQIPGRPFHNGSRLTVGPDDKLYLSTGDAGSPPLAQDPAVLSGKILRLNLDGTVPADNPIAGSPVWSLGHRNAQGLVFATSGRLYASEHGANNDDEVNFIQRGRNYGWPIIEGFIDKPAEKEAAAGKNFTEPLRAWTPTIATSGLAYYDNPAIPEWKNVLLLANLKGRALRVLELDGAGDKITKERIFLQERVGRLRDVCVSPSGEVFLVTSNTDWHPKYQSWMYSHLQPGPDQILRLRAVKAGTSVAGETWTEDLKPLPLETENWTYPATTEDLLVGQGLYAMHCAACHRPDGTGVPTLFPPLTKGDWVKNKGRLIQVALRGLTGRITVDGQNYEQEMPSFRNLTDDELAALLTYVRATFGPGQNAVIPAEVAEERKGLR